MLRIITILIILSITFPAFSMTPSAKKNLNHLVDLLVDPQMVEPLQLDFFQKIESGLNMTNRSIFEELLMEAGVENKEVLRLQYQMVEGEMNQNLRKAFGQGVNFLSIFQEASKEIYKRNYSPAEIKELIRFFSTKTGKKYLSKSQSIMEESQSELSKRLYELAIQLSQPLQEAMQQKVMEILKNAEE